MPTVTVTDARKNLLGLVDDVANEHRGYCIVGKRHQAVLISMEDWSAIQESLYLNSFPGLADSIVKGLKTPVSDCATELKWRTGVSSTRSRRKRTPSASSRQG